MLTFVFYCIENIGSTPGFNGGSVIQIPLSMFRRETSSTKLCKPNENHISDFMKNRHLDHRKPVRYALHERNNTRPDHSKGHINFYVNPLGFIINLKISALPATQKLEFLGLEIGSVNVDLWFMILSQCSWPSLFANENSRKFNSEIQKFDRKSQTKNMGNYKLDRFIFLNSTSCDTSIRANKISATTTSGIYKKAISLPLNSSSESKFNSWSSMVGKKPRNIKWEVNFITYKQNHNPSRCFSEGLVVNCQ